MELLRLLKKLLESLRAIFTDMPREHVTVKIEQGKAAIRELTVPVEI